MPKAEKSRVLRFLAALLCVALVATACGLSEEDLEAAVPAPADGEASVGEAESDPDPGASPGEEAGEDAGETETGEPDTTEAPIAPEDREPLDERPATGTLAGLDDRYYPLLGNRGYDVARYDIDLALSLIHI